MTKRLFIVFILCAFAVISHAQVLKKNEVVPDFKGKTTDGTEFHLKEALKDKYVLLNFTAINCGYCWVIYPSLINMQEKYKEQLEIVCVYNLDRDTPEEWEASVKRSYNKEYASKLIDNKLTSVWQASFLNDTHCSPEVGWPYCFLIGKDGKVIKRFIPREKALAKLLEKELGKD